MSIVYVVYLPTVADKQKRYSMK